MSKEELRAVIDEVFEGVGGCDGFVEAVKRLAEREGVRIVDNERAYHVHETPSVLGHRIMRRPRFAFRRGCGKLETPAVLLDERRN